MYRSSARPAPLDLPYPVSHSTYNTERRNDVGHSLPQTTVYYESSTRDGLPTPPEDKMATAYQNAPYNNSYSAGRNSEYLSVEAPPSNYGAAYNGNASQSRSYMSLPQPPPASASTLRREVQGSQPLYSQPPSPQPAPRADYLPHEESSSRRSTSGVIRPSLQIPPAICESGGSLAEFAAQITCLFWFESIETLQKAEGISTVSPLVKRLEKEALPSTGFRKWVVTILSTTQVTDNVILLALLFIYRLKTSNPAVKGRSGSEYRLLTVALMLGNKFLDDNTYTNKTWAEVSGISVTEIHVMEVEFLSNMRYSLLASSEQWAEWHQKLRKFRIYCDRAAEAPLLVSPQRHASLQPNLPSPPTNQRSPPLNPYSSHPAPYTNGHHWPPSNALVPLPSPLSSLSDSEYRGYNRKRSYDDEAEEPVAKRITRPSAGPAQYPPVVAPLRSDAPRLPVPNLTISTSQPMSNGYHSATTQPQNMPLLPPLGGRAMSGVYPTTPSHWGAPQLPMPTPTGHHTGYSTPSRRHSPHSVQELLSYASSPISANFPHHNAAHFSPSFFLQQRSSPYKPVRHVNTLLYPPPSASLHDYSVNADQMHYQPLGKRNDYRSGIVPDYNHPPYQHWPVLPQPNFHA